MRASRLAGLGLAVLMGGACDRAPATPPAPTPSLPAVTGITITGVPASLSIGQTVQLSASVTLPDGTSLRTSEATWISSNVAVVTISSTGLLTVVGPGDADVTAAFQSVRGVAHVAIAKPSVTYDISGVVHESVPTENVVLPGATVGIHFAGCPTCPHDNQETTTDEAGRFTLHGVETAGFTLWASKRGYEAAPFQVSQLPRDQTVDVGLTPEAVRLHSLFTGNLCMTSSDPFAFRYSPNPPFWMCAPGKFPYPTEMHHGFLVHRPGTATVAVTYLYAGDYYWNYLSVQVLCGNQVIVEKKIANLWNNHPGTTGPFQVELPQACAYQVRLFDFDPDVKGGDWTTYHVDIDHLK